MSDLSNALKSYLGAAEAVRKAESECDEDRDYFLHSEYEHLERTEEAFLDCLIKRIEERKGNKEPPRDSGMGFGSHFKEE